MATTTESKVGAAVMGLGLLVWLAPAVYYRYPIRVPLSVALPLSKGASLQERFVVRGSQEYNVLLRCTKTGEFREKWTNFLAPKESLIIPCQITLRVLQDGHQVHSAHLTSLQPATLSGDHAFWSLGPFFRPASTNFN